MSQIIVANTYVTQPHHIAAISRKLPKPEVVYLPPVGLMNAGGKGVSKALSTSGTLTETHTPQGKGMTIGSSTAGVYAACEGNSSNRFTVLISFICGTLSDTKGIFQWATGSATVGSPFLLLQHGASGILRTYYGSGYRNNSRVGWLVPGRHYTAVVRGYGGGTVLYGEGLNFGSVSASAANAKTHVWFGNGYAGSLLDNTILLGVVWTSDIGDSHAAYLSANPWGVFEPSGVKLFFPDTGPSEPNTYTLEAEAGSFESTGGEASFTRNYRLEADVGMCQVSGGAIQRQLTRVLQAEVGISQSTGSIVAFDYQNVGGVYTLNAAGGSFYSAGGDATLRASRILPAEVGEFYVSFGSMTFRRTRKLHASSGVFTFSGGDADFTFFTPTVYRLSAEVGTFEYAGGDATFTYNYVIRDRWGKEDSTTGDWTKDDSITGNWS